MPPRPPLPKAVRPPAPRYTGAPSALASGLPADYGSTPAPKLGLAPGDYQRIQRAHIQPAASFVARNVPAYTGPGFAYQLGKAALRGNAGGAALAAAGLIPIAGPLERLGVKLGTGALARGTLLNDLISGTPQGVTKISAYDRSKGTNPRGSKVINNAAREAETGKFFAPFNPRALGTNPRARGEGRAPHPEGPVVGYQLHVNGRMVSEHGPVKQHAFEAANLLREQGIEPQIVSVRGGTIEQKAAARLAELEGKHQSFLQKVHSQMFLPKLTADDRAEQARRNVYNGKALRQQAGVTRAGKPSGASGRKYGRLKPTVKTEQMRAVQAEIDRRVAANPGHPAVQAYVNQQREMAQLREALKPMPGEPVNHGILQRLLGQGGQGGPPGAAGMQGFVSWTPAQYKAFMEREGAAATYKGDLSAQRFLHASNRRLIGDQPSTRYANSGVMYTPGIFANTLPGRVEGHIGFQRPAERQTPALMPVNKKGPGAPTLTAVAANRRAATALAQRLAEQGHEITGISEAHGALYDKRALERLRPKAQALLRRHAPELVERGSVTRPYGPSKITRVINSGALPKSERPHKVAYRAELPDAPNVIPLRVKPGAKVLDLSQPLGVGERSRMLHAVRDLNRLRVRRGQLHPADATAIEQKIARAFRNDSATLSQIGDSLGHGAAVSLLRAYGKSGVPNPNRPMLSAESALEALTQHFVYPQSDTSRPGYPFNTAALKDRNKILGEAGIGPVYRSPLTPYEHGARQSGTGRQPQAGDASLANKTSPFGTSDVLRRLGYDAVLDPNYSLGGAHGAPGKELIALRNQAIEPFYRRGAPMSPRAVQIARALQRMGINVNQLRREKAAAFNEVPVTASAEKLTGPPTPNLPISDELRLFFLGGKVPAVGRTPQGAQPVNAETALRLIRSSQQRLHEGRTPPSELKLRGMVGPASPLERRLLEPDRLANAGLVAQLDQLGASQRNPIARPSTPPKNLAELEAFLKARQPQMHVDPNPIRGSLHSVKLPTNYFDFNHDRNGRGIETYSKPPKAEDFFEPGALAASTKGLPPEVVPKHLAFIQEQLNQNWEMQRLAARSLGELKLAAIKRGRAAGLSGAELRHYIQVYTAARKPPR